MNASANQSTLPAEFAARYGPWAVIAGASDGIGEAFAHQIAAAGISCVLVARRAPLLESLGRELKQRYGVNVQVECIDLAQADAAQTLGRVTADLPVGLLVYVAGSDTHGTRFINTPISEWTAMVGRNVDTLLRSTHVFGARMANARRGGMVLVGSYAAFGGADRLNVYSATKAFGLNLGESLWAELRPLGVDVLNLLLDATDTPTLRAALARHGIPIEAVALALPADVARAGLAALGQGPTLIYGGDDSLGHPFQSDHARRQRVIEISDRLSLFYGKA
jgi:short-subunit dehydrogenase